MSLLCKTRTVGSVRTLLIAIFALYLVSVNFWAVAASNAAQPAQASVNSGHATNVRTSTTKARTAKSRIAKPRTALPRTANPRAAKSTNLVRLKIEVPCRAWLPKNVQPKVVLLCVHGLGLNSAAFEQFGQQMQKEGIGVFAVDVRGFGTWMQLKGKTELDFKSCISDVEKALKVLHIAYPDKPLFVLGESMGGAIAMRVAADHPDLIRGLISAVPSGDRFHKTKNQLRVALQMVTLRGNKQIDIGTKVVEEATNDQALQTSWKDDPLNRLKLSSNELRQFQRFMNENHETAERIDNIPVLFLVGLSDRLAKPEGTIELFDEISADDKKLVTIKSAEHLIFEHHKLSPEIKGVVIDWLLSHANKSQEDD